MTLLDDFHTIPFNLVVGRYLDLVLFVTLSRAIPDDKSGFCLQQMCMLLSLTRRHKLCQLSQHVHIGVTAVLYDPIVWVPIPPWLVRCETHVVSLLFQILLCATPLVPLLSVVRGLCAW